jgi:PhnB protein
MQVQPYLFFNGRCEEAAEFYRTALGAEVVSMMRMSDSPEAHPPGMLPPGSERKIMHMSLRIGEATVMASRASRSRSMPPTRPTRSGCSTR